MKQLRKGISVVTITLNEEKNIENFINSHKMVADEIIVVDSRSTDNTVNIAKKLGAKVILNDWKGYAHQWNVGIKASNYEWIIIGDADHQLSKELIQEINSMKINNKINNYDAYYIPRKNIMFNKWVKHGGFYPDIPYPRMFSNGLGFFDETARVHEKLVFSGKQIGHFKNVIEHRTFMDFETYINKMNKYTTLEAIMLCKKNENNYGFKSIFINGKFNKAIIRKKLPFRPVVVFVYRYFFKLGFLDGKVGLYMAVLSFVYELVVNMKIWQIKKSILSKDF